MSLEEQLAANTAALKENTAAILASKGSAAAAPAKDAPKTAPAKAAPKKPKHTADEIKAAVTALAKAKGKPAAAAVIAEFEVENLAGLLAAPEKFDEAFVRLTAAAEETAEEDDTDGL